MAYFWNPGLHKYLKISNLTKNALRYLFSWAASYHLEQKNCWWKFWHTTKCEGKVWGEKITNYKSFTRTWPCRESYWVENAHLDTSDTFHKNRFLSLHIQENSGMGSAVSGGQIQSAPWMAKPHTVSQTAVSRDSCPFRFVSGAKGNPTQGALHPSLVCFFI